MKAVDIGLIGVPSFIVEVDQLDGTLRYGAANVAYETETGIMWKMMVGKTPHQCMPKAFADAVEPRYRRCVETKMLQQYDEELEMSGGPRWWRTVLTPEVDVETGMVLRILGIAIEITELKRLERELQHVAFTDELTGVASRRGFSSRSEAVTQAAAKGSSGFSLILIDVDGFKSINDNHGHIVGDAVLREIASRIQFALPDAEIVARLGGDEFVVIVSDKTDDDLAISIEAVSSAICRWLSVGSLTIPVSASVGGAIWQPGVTIDGLMSFADARMYACKSRRRRTA